MAGWTGKKVNVHFTRNEEPSFLKKFKERVGYKEDNGLSEKFQVMPKATDEDLNDGDDELPQVVQLKPGDISESEYKDIISEGKNDEVIDNADDIPADGRILFRKPAHKRSKEGEAGLKSSSKKIKKDSEEKPKNNKEKKNKEESNKKLLSFDEDEEDGDT